MSLLIATLCVIRRSIIDKKVNNLHRPVTLKIAVTAIVIIIALITPQILNVIYPNHRIIQAITEGWGWYAYMGLLLILATAYDFMHFKKK